MGPSLARTRAHLAPNLDLRPAGRHEYLAGIEASPPADIRPNVIVVLFDDMGQGDLSCYGAGPISTPRLDALAEDGVVLDDFYASSSVCSASRFGLVTGRYPTRGFVHAVFFPTSSATGRALNAVGFPRGVRGILPDEVTIADALAAAGYRTALFGKWHLGDRSPALPNDCGFELFFGSPYSNDMVPYEYWRNREVAVPAPIDQTRLTEMLTEEVCRFVAAPDDRPFFALYASPFPHDPVHAGAPFTGSSQAGTYGDCVQELDWSVGAILDSLDAAGRRDDTIVIVTSDNGPWYEGSPGFHRGRKSNTFDGGQIVPFIASWPGRFRSGLRCPTAAMNIDLFPTIAACAGIPVPDDRAIDGVDLAPLLRDGDTAPLHDELLFIKGRTVQGIRDADDYKYFRRHQPENSTYFMLKQGPFLFRISTDPNESYDLRSAEPERAAALAERLDGWSRRFATDPRGWLA